MQVSAFGYASGRLLLQRFSRPFLRRVAEREGLATRDYLVSSSAVLQVCKFMRTPSKVLLYSSGRLDMSPYSSRSCRMHAFYGGESSFKAPKSPYYILNLAECVECYTIDIIDYVNVVYSIYGYT